MAINSVMRFNTSVALVGVLLVAGCSHTLRFKTVDATTEKPLAGVALKWEDRQKDLIFGTAHFGPTNLPPSGDDGLIVVVGVHKKRVTAFDFTKPGYVGVSCFYSGGSLARVDGTNSIANPSGTPYEVPRMVEILPTNDLMIIRMRSE